MDARTLDKAKPPNDVTGGGAKAWKPPTNGYESGTLQKYAGQVGPNRKGAMTHQGGKAEVTCHADL